MIINNNYENYNELKKKKKNDLPNAPYGRNLISETTPDVDFRSKFLASGKLGYRQEKKYSP